MVINCNKYGIKLHKIDIFFLHWPWPFFSLSYSLLPVGCLPLLVLKWQKKREHLLTLIMWSKSQVAKDGGARREAIVLKSSKLKKEITLIPYIINLWFLFLLYFRGLRFGRIPFLRLMTVFTIKRAGMKGNHIYKVKVQAKQLLGQHKEECGSFSTFFQCLSPLEYLAPSSEVLVLVMVWSCQTDHWSSLGSWNCLFMWTTI